MCDESRLLLCLRMHTDLPESGCEVDGRKISGLAQLVEQFGKGKLSGLVTELSAR